MDMKIIFAVILMVVLISIQWTLNLILQEIKSIRISLGSYKSERMQEKMKEDMRRNI